MNYFPYSMTCTLSFFTAFGYISDVDTALSGDNSSIIVTCSLACQTDFITGCSISLSGCGEQTTLSCTVDGSFEYRPRQCSVEFQNLLPTSYLYTASVMTDIDMPLMREENVLSITGSFATSGMFIWCIWMYVHFKYVHTVLNVILLLL